jgi:hypothetical protein
VIWKDVVRKTICKFEEPPTINITYEKGFRDFNYPKILEIKFYSYRELEVLYK